jgi:hypothetical protein
MTNPSSHILDLTKRGAVLRYQELAHELHLLLELFPDLADSFDPDELPVSFILTRDARDAAAAADTRRRRLSASGRRAVNRRMKQAWTQRRAGTKS